MRLLPLHSYDAVPAGLLGGEGVDRIALVVAAGIAVVLAQVYAAEVELKHLQLNQSDSPQSNSRGHAVAAETTVAYLYQSAGCQGAAFPLESAVLEPPHEQFVLECTWICPTPS